ncbi:MAG: glycosyltransferase family 2 protein [Chitinophagaceae bacterium]|nr:glycosyltransferase family 2 protein [Chitinophagaceae bacterium]
MQNNSPLVTVGIPTYNRPAGLEKTLQCILAQSYRNLEVIVSDNCSTDETVLPLLKKYAALDSRVTFFVQEKNRSIVPNFQFLLDKAKGDYFMWAADDDNWDPNFIEVCVQGLQTNPDVVLCMTDLKLTRVDGVSGDSKLNRSFMQANLFSRCFHFVKSTAENKYFFCGLYRTTVIKNIPFDNSWGGDHLFIYETLTKGKFLLIQGLANFYYFRGGSSKGMDSVRKAFNIKARYHFFDAYILKYTTHQFRFKHLSFFKKLGLFFSNAAGLIFNEDFILYYIFIKKPVKALIRIFKKKPLEHHP